MRSQTDRWVFFYTSSQSDNLDIDIQVYRAVLVPLPQATWAVSHPDFCAGTAQSPIDLDSTKAMVMNPGEVKMVGYNVAQPAYIGNNGHTLGFGFRSGVTPYIHGGRLPEGDRLDFSILQP